MTGTACSRRSFIAASGLAALLPSRAFAGPDPDQARRFGALDTALERMGAEARVPGLAVGIVEAGEPVYARVWGVCDLQSGVPVTTDTLFHIASISKTFTATAILQLAEQRRLALDDPLERHLPVFAGSGIRLEQLLTHSAGLADWFRPSGTATDADVARYAAKIARHRRAYPPGQGWEYSDADFNILGAVIEAASGELYPDYLERRVLAAAHMPGSLARRPGVDTDYAWPHHGEREPRRARTHPWDRVFIPSSGIECSISELMRWAQLNLARDPALLTSASYDALFTRRVDTTWSGIAMGLGWQLEKRGSGWLPRHPGGDPGFRSLLTLYPEQRRAIAILSNGESTPRFEIRGVIEAALDSGAG